jgi:hypothetical protein
MRLPNENDINQIDQLVRACGTDVSRSQTTWQELFAKPHVKSVTVRPYKIIGQKRMSRCLQDELTQLGTMRGRESEAIASVGWSFLFSDTSNVSGAPSAQKIPFTDLFPHFALSFEYDPFRLLTGWGTTQYKCDLGGQVRRLETICSRLGKLPAGIGLIMTDFPRFTVIAGYLALAVLEIIDGYLNVWTRVGETPIELDKRMKAVRQGKHPGEIFRLKEDKSHVINIDFLREWIKSPSFDLF